jgi:hypothetical protein
MSEDPRPDGAIPGMHVADAKIPAEGERMAIAPELMDRPAEGPAADSRPGCQA